MQNGTFVGFKGWSIWVEYAWLGRNQSLQDVAESIYESGWLNNAAERTEANQPKEKEAVAV